MGGTFDPIHFGHLVAAEEARLRFGLDEVVFVPCGTPPLDKHYDVTSAEDRYAMVLLATCDNPHFSVSRVELERPGPSYTIDTVRRFKQEHPPETSLFFITGADAVLDILSWHRNGELIEECQFIAATRPGYDLSQLEERLGRRHAARIEVLQVPGIEISSTEIRQRVREGKPARYLTPDLVWRYIEKLGLYREPSA
jgi:nicotinate-nucleotide adenylyltransferase